jgi:hypothetical protein
VIPTNTNPLPFSVPPERNRHRRGMDRYHHAQWLERCKICGWGHYGKDMIADQSQNFTTSIALARLYKKEPDHAD